uniref:Sodium/nucleoside cotransporter n=1 Tax=Panagrolaimus superbus TaxID=310955 RepID=A0A914Z1Z5_9BILA
MYIFSKSPSRIRWRPVIWGFFVQFIFGLLILRWEWGAWKFSQISQLIVTFLSFADVGSHFVYGFLTNPPNICKMDTVFAFSYLQIIIYCGAVVAVLFYFGIIQAVLKWMGWFMQISLGTTAPESLNACGCVFLGIGESIFLIKPYLIKMTPSEIHAVMTSGFSCIAGSLFVAYIGFGACPSYLLSATVMSAPGSLACSKLLFPETKKSKLSKMDQLQLDKGPEANALECLSNGAVAAIEIVQAIIANIIVTLAIIAFFNACIGYLGTLVGYQNWSVENFVGYLFYPLAYLMGVTENSNEIMIVAKLMGIKTVANEFVAYQHLGQYVTDNALSPRSAMIATYALCGFSNFQTLGIVLAILGSMVPTRKSLISSLALRALMAGSISCFMTASLAGVLVENPIHCGRAERPPCFDVEKFQNISNFFNFANITTAHNEL